MSRLTEPTPAQLAEGRRLQGNDRLEWFMDHAEVILAAAERGLAADQKIEAAFRDGWRRGTKHLHDAFAIFPNQEEDAAWRHSETKKAMETQ